MVEMVFDVESIGLHGEAYAVGGVVFEGLNIIDQFLYACPPARARGTEDSFVWIDHNTPDLMPNVDSPSQVRGAFWARYMDLRKKYPDLRLWADCGWPVEARFLIACIEDDHEDREWSGPYPFFDIATVAAVRGRDPKATHPRQRGEEQVHNPLHDARQSARLLAEMLMSDGPLTLHYGWEDRNAD